MLYSKETESVCEQIYAAMEMIKEDGRDNFTLSDDEIAELGGVTIDHAFLNCKIELLEYGYEVGKISLKNKTVNFIKTGEVIK
jgi:hypothetical protein